MLKYILHLIRPDSRQNPGRAALTGFFALFIVAILLLTSCQVVPTPITESLSPSTVESTDPATPSPGESTTTTEQTSGQTEPTTDPTTEETTGQPTEPTSSATNSPSPSATKPVATSTPKPTTTSTTPQGTTTSRPTTTTTTTNQPTTTTTTTSQPTSTPTPAPTSTPAPSPTPVPPAAPAFPYRNYGTYFRDDYGSNSNIITSGDGGIQLDIGSSSQGVALVNVSSSSIPLDKSCKVIAAANGQSYQYEILARGKYLGIPLQFGKGEYTITVYAQVSGNSYSSALAHSFTVDFSSSLKPFLASSMMTDFSKSSNTTRTASSISSGIDTTNGRVEAVYNWIVKNIRYDDALASAITSGEVSVYVPDPEKTFNTKKGICFDYASLMCAMLRSQGIPTRLAVGQTPLGYHAWNEVYFSGTGWVVVASFSWQNIDGSGWVKFDTTFAAGGMSPQNINDTNHVKQKTY